MLDRSGAVIGVLGAEPHCPRSLVFMPPPAAAGPPPSAVLMGKV